MYICNSMPTFLILKGTHVKETIRGANPTALRTAVLAAAADAAKGPAASAGAFFAGKGQTRGWVLPARRLRPDTPDRIWALRSAVRRLLGRGVGCRRRW
jgi:hypothetical protein